jgi:hypothetical protein
MLPVRSPAKGNTVDRMNGTRAFAIVAAAGIALLALSGCSVEACSTSAQAPPHVLIDPPASFPGHPHSVVHACVKSRCTDVAAGHFGSLGVPSGRSAKVAVSVESGGANWSSSEITVSMKELGKTASACGTSPSNIAGALTINADGTAM